MSIIFILYVLQCMQVMKYYFLYEIIFQEWRYEMSYENYIGHPSQITGVEEYRLIGGKGDGMRLFQIRNGKGLDLTISADRCTDISRINFQGSNMNYFSPCGYTSPQYYDKEGFEFLKSFYCGFLTTCGLGTIGSPSTDGEKSYPLHGNISHIPAEHIYYIEKEDVIEIHARIVDASIFSYKLALKRIISCSKKENLLTVKDVVKNEGTNAEPIMLLYHINIGYPLLDENAELAVSSSKVLPRDARANENLNEWNKMLPPESNFSEQCYYHYFNQKKAVAKIYNRNIDKGLAISFDTDTLPLMTEWKMMGNRDYVLGLEPCTNQLEGRSEIHKKHELSYLNPGESRAFGFEVRFTDCKDEWVKL